MAPEALKSREYSEATDAFSFGVLLWCDMTRHDARHARHTFLTFFVFRLMLISREMMARKRPWAGVEPVQIITSVTSNTRLRIPKDCDPIFAQLMKMCWRQNPSQRYSCWLTHHRTRHHRTRTRATAHALGSRHWACV
jgi:hypothetical protein